MERDFLGLGTKTAPVTFKEESTDSSKDFVPMRNPGLQWSFSNKVSAAPQFLSFKPHAEDKSRKAVHDLTGSLGYVSISKADAFDSNQRPYSGMFQKSTSLDKQSGNHYTITTYPVPAQHFDSYPVHRPQETRIFPAANQQTQTVTVSMASPSLQSHYNPVVPNVVGSSINSHPLGGVPIVAPVTVLPTANSIIGTTNLRDGSKSSPAPAQLTIFYAGSVCVYDDVSPEKAQAIMYLAGNGSSTTQNKLQPPMVQVQAPISRPSVADAYARNRTLATSSCSGHPSPISVSANSNSDPATVKPIGALASSANQSEPSKTVSSVRPASAALGSAVAVPQARKASLARFLEKRKERVMSTSPYNTSKKSSEMETHGSDGGVILSINSSSSFPQLASN